MKTPYDSWGYENIGWIELFLWVKTQGGSLWPGKIKYALINFDAESRLHRERTGHYGLGSNCIICGTAR